MDGRSGFMKNITVDPTQVFSAGTSCESLSQEIRIPIPSQKDSLNPKIKKQSLYHSLSMDPIPLPLSEPISSQKDSLNPKIKKQSLHHSLSMDPNPLPLSEPIPSQKDSLNPKIKKQSLHHSLSMDLSEAAKILFSRIQTIDLENATKIISLFRIQGLDDMEMIRLAFGPQSVLSSRALQAKQELGLFPLSSTLPSQPFPPPLPLPSPDMMEGERPHQETPLLDALMEKLRSLFVKIGRLESQTKFADAYPARGQIRRKIFQSILGTSSAKAEKSDPEDKILYHIRDRVSTRLLVEDSVKKFPIIESRWTIYNDFRELVTILPDVQSMAANAEREPVKSEAMELWLRKVGDVAHDAMDALEKLEATQFNFEFAVMLNAGHSPINWISQRFNELAKECTSLLLERRGFMKVEFPILPLLDSILKNLKSVAKEDSSSLSVIDKGLQKISATLSTVRPTVEEAEQKQAESSDARSWLQRLKDVAYDLDDVLDEYATEALQSDVDKHVRGSSLSSLSSSSFELVMGRKLNAVGKRLDEVTEACIGLHLNKGGDWGIQYQGGIQPHMQTSSFLNESEAFGRHDDREKIIELLLSDGFRGKNVSTIAIAGMGGVGKTTLAQLAFNDERVGRNFHLRSWVSVSRYFDLKIQMKSIIESATKKHCKLEDMSSLEGRIREILKGKRFLLVLDDVWNVNDSSAWDPFYKIVGCGAKGSKIVITTRIQPYSSFVDADRIYNLEGLSYEDCFSWFKQLAFGRGSPDAHAHLEAYGMEIVRKYCKGLPLAVKTLGRALQFEFDEEKWRFILAQKIWDIPEVMNVILPTLRLSYYHLPAHVKKCFAFCSMFPKDYEFEKDELVQLWMAEGFLQLEGTMQMEEIGDEYFNDLLRSSFFQSSRGNKARYRMHDFIHSLAQSVSDEECFMAEVGKSCHIAKRARHSYLVCHSLEPKFFEAFYKASGLRTFLLHAHNKHPHFNACIERIVSDVPVKLKCLRVLDLSHTEITELPDSIGNLKHLRYLNLSRTYIRRLPESTSTLLNLQTLKLYHCSKLIELPKDMRNLINLRHLCLDMCLSKITSLPPGIGRLACLQTLPYFVVGTQSGYRIQEVKDMVHLQGALSISKLENVVSMMEAKEANLKSKNRLVRLELRWSHDDADLRDEGIEEKILEGLQPQANLSELLIENYNGTRFPSWVMDLKLVKLVKIELLNCRNCKVLPPLGELPFLEDLCLTGIHRVNCVDRDFYGEGVECFPLLERLVFCAMADLEEWFSMADLGELFRLDEYHSLRELRICYCPKLKYFPLLSPTLVKLEIRSCEELPAIPKFPSLRDLKIKDCSEVILSSIPYLTSLVSLTISQIPELTSLSTSFLRPLKSLEQLKIKECNELMCLNEEEGLQDLVSLRQLEIERCPLLTSMVDEELPITLEDLRISSCLNLTALPKGLQKLASLRHLEICACPQLLFLPQEGMPPTLQSLRIRGCYMLEKHCQKEVGEDWCKIKDIHRISIDGYDQFN